MGFLRGYISETIIYHEAKLYPIPALPYGEVQQIHLDKSSAIQENWEIWFELFCRKAYPFGKTIAIEKREAL